MPKNLSKKVRFEVFKRDGFKCQYCGRSAPDVILHADHIQPKSKGGSNDIMNLITSCQACNSGKGARKLDDKSVVKKQVKQLQELNERSEQLKMMISWREGLSSIENQKLEIVVNKWHEHISPHTLTPHGIKSLKLLFNKFDLSEVLDAIEAASSKLAYDTKNVCTYESASQCFKLIGRICAAQKACKNNPILKDLYYIRGILRNRLSYIKPIPCLQLLKEATEKGASVDGLKALALTSRNWTVWKADMKEKFGVED